MRVSTLLVVLAFVSPLLCSAQIQQVEGPNLIVRKKIHFDYTALSVDRNFTVELNVFNVGTEDAYDVELRDLWPEESFEVPEGSTTMNWPVIAPNERKDANITLVPKQAGTIRGFRAVVQYKVSEDTERVMQGFSTPTQEYRIFEKEIFDKLTDKHYLDWAIFWGVCGASIVLPLASYFTTRSEFHDAQKKK